ncbi:MAG: hypothetical protein ACXW1M_03475 [Acidimicrobiia bacterium]
MAKVASGKKPATKKSAPAKKTAAKKPPAKVAAKKAVGKVAAKKASAKKPVPAKKAAAKKSPASAKKALATKQAAKSAARGSTKQAAKSRTTKTPAKKLPAKPTPKAPAKKSTAKRATAEVKAAPAPVAPKSIYAREEVKLPKGAVFCPLSGIIVTPQKPNINPKTLARLRAVLEEELAKHIRQADDLRAEADQLASEREQGDTQFDEESGEGDTVSVERERDLLLSASARQTVDEIRAALERMDAGTYGLCTPAGRRINIARLDAIPWADQCVDCKSARERRR